MQFNIPRQMRGVLSTAQLDPERTKNGDIPGSPAVLDRLAAMTPGVGAPMPQDNSTQLVTPPAATAPSLPPVPPTIAGKAKDTNPWAHGNRSRTLLDIGNAFLSHDGFFKGFGAAGEAIGAREDGLKAAAVKQSTFGGPGGQFEIVTNPDGTKTVRVVPEFAAYNDAERESKRKDNSPKPKDIVDLRSRAIHAIQQLPEGERQAAYADLMLHPDRYGGLDTTGMPDTYDPRYGSVMGGMGETVPQAISHDIARDGNDIKRHDSGVRERQGDARIAQGAQRVSQGEYRMKHPSSGRRAATTKPPAGFILD